MSLLTEGDQVRGSVLYVIEQQNRIQTITYNNLNKSVCVCVCVQEISERVNLKNGKSYGTSFFSIVPSKL